MIKWRVKPMKCPNCIGGYIWGTGQTCGNDEMGDFLMSECDTCNTFGLSQIDHETSLADEVLSAFRSAGLEHA